MSGEDRILNKLDRIAEDGAATRADVKNLYSYVQAVSSNQKKTEEKLDEHREDIDAHGGKAVGKRDHSLLQLVTLGLALIGTALGLKSAAGHTP